MLLDADVLPWEMDLFRESELDALFNERDRRVKHPQF